MNYSKPIQTIQPAPEHPTLWLAAENGRRLAPPRLDIAPADAPELPMVVRFEGLSEAQQKKALAGFPGGKRFVLAG